MSDTNKRSSRTNAEIEALLREQAAREIVAGDRRVSREVAQRLRRGEARIERSGRMRSGARIDDGERVPRWFLAAAGLGIAVLAGWLVFAPGSSGPGTTPKQTIAAHDAKPTLPSPGLFKVSAGQLLAMAIEPQDERLRKEARALAGAGWELAGRVIGGIPIELVKPIAEQRRSASDERS